MFEHFTERLRRVLFFARFEAEHRRHPAASGVHLMLALLRENQGETATILTKAGVDLGTLTHDLDTLAHDIRTGMAGRADATDRDRPDENRLGLEARHLLEVTRDEAVRLGHHDVSTGHLLLALIRESHTSVAAILAAHGLRLEDTRARVAELHVDEPARPEAATPHPMAHVLKFRQRPDIPHAPGVYITEPRSIEGSRSDRGTDEYWLLSGFTLKEALSRIMGDGMLPFPESRIVLPPALANHQQYDFALVLAAGERAGRNELMRQGIERHFRVTIDRAADPSDVYVLNAPHGLHPALTAVEDGGVGVGHMSFASTAADIPAFPLRAEAIGEMSFSGASMDLLCHMLSEVLDRPVVNETGLDGIYEVALSGAATGFQEFANRLRDQLGLELTQARREIPAVVVREGR